jgi:hypothetical protein
MVGKFENDGYENSVEQLSSCIHTVNTRLNLLLQVSGFARITVGFMAFVTGRPSNTATDGQRSTWMATAERPKRPTATRKTDFVSLSFVASFSRRIIAQATPIIHAVSLRPKRPACRPRHKLCWPRPLAADACAPPWLMQESQRGSAFEMRHTGHAAALLLNARREHAHHHLDSRTALWNLLKVCCYGLFNCVL